MPKPSTTDPLKDAMADKELVRGGMKSISQCIRELGYDPDEVRAELAADHVKYKAAGLTVDTDSAVTEGLAAKLLEQGRMAVAEKAQEDVAQRQWDRVLQMIDRV
jgi:capsid protein